MDSSNYTFKVKHPHHTYIDDLIENGTTDIHNPNTGQYLCKLAANGCKNLFGLTTIKHNHWRMYKKNPFRLAFPGSKYNYYTK